MLNVECSIRVYQSFQHKYIAMVLYSKYLGGGAVSLWPYTTFSLSLDN